MKFGKYTFEEFVEIIKSFHGTIAPGILLGGFMVNLAQENLLEGDFFDVICETKTCLPDAIQLLTPCSMGNGWLRIIDLGRFAVIFHEKYTGKGIRIFVDAEKLAKYPDIRDWFLKLKPKSMQDSERLLEQIKIAGTSILSIQQVQVNPEYSKKKKGGKISICPICTEPYPASHGSICKGCTEDLPYGIIRNTENTHNKLGPLLNKTPVGQAIGMHLLHDITKIIHQKEKGVAFKKGHVISEEDVHSLRALGKNNVYALENNPFIKGYIHEDDAVSAFVELMKGRGVYFDRGPDEGKIDLLSEIEGLLVINEKQLENFNKSSGVICASLSNYSVVKKGDKIAGTRIIPLYISNTDYLKAISHLDQKPLFEVLPFRKAKVGVLATGTEVYENLIKDEYTRIIKSKAEAYGCEVVSEAVVPDNIDAICDGIRKMLNMGADLIITTAGLSVDPDDVTLEAIIKAGAEDILYGIPVLPGSMLLSARIDNAQVIGVPACGLYNSYFSIDLLLPRILASIPVTGIDLARMGNGGLLLQK